MLPHTLNHLIMNVFPYSSIVLTQASSLMTSGPGQAKALLLGINARFFTRMTPILYTLPAVTALPLQQGETKPLAAQETRSTPPTRSLLDLPPEILHAVAEKLGPYGKLRFLSTCSTLRNFYPPAETTWLPFQIADERLFSPPSFNIFPPPTFNKSLGKRCYRELLLRLLNPETTNLERIAIFAEKLHGKLLYTGIAEVLEQVLQQSALNVPKQWEKLARVNLHLCVTLSGIATMRKLAEYGIDRHFFSGRFSRGNRQIEDLLNRIKATRAHSALDCAVEAGLREITIDLITYPGTPGLCLADVLISAISKRDIATVNLFLENNVNMDLQNKDGTTALMAASRVGLQETVQLLLDRGANTELQDNHGGTALVLACIKEQVTIAKLLLDHGANVNLQPKNGVSVLMMACMDGQIAIAQLLLDNGANINLQNNDGWTALMLACRGGHITTAQLLLNYRANIGLQDENGRTALMVASKAGKTETAQLLLNHGANTELQDNYGATALMLACKKEQTAIVQLLLARGARVNLRDKTGRTALMIACSKKHAVIAKQLLNHGANTELQDTKGHTALIYACRAKSRTMIKHLLQHGAKITSQTLSAAEESGDKNIIQLLRIFQQQAMQET